MFCFINCIDLGPSGRRAAWGSSGDRRGRCGPPVYESCILHASHCLGKEPKYTLMYLLWSPALSDGVEGSVPKHATVVRHPPPHPQCGHFYVPVYVSR